MKEGIKLDTGKTRYDLMSASAIEKLARVLTKGAAKYEAHNWRNGIAFSRLIGAMNRHLAAIEAGEDYDIGPGGDGDFHAAHLLCETMFLLESYDTHPEMDDRYLPVLKPRRIGLDIDDVLADFVGAYCARYEMERPQWWACDYKFGDRYKELMDDADFWLDMGVRTKPENIPFEPVCYITSRGCPKGLTEAWLVKNGFPQVPVYYSGVDGSKVEIAKREKLDIFVDDRYENMVDLTENGVFTYLFSQPHNARYMVGHRRINELSEIGARL